MTKEKQRAALEFMFRQIGKSIYWRPGALTLEGNPNGNPPALNPSEAESFFSFLSQKGLIILAPRSSSIITSPDFPDEPTYLIDATKEAEWKKLIEQTKYGWFKNSWSEIRGFTPVHGEFAFKRQLAVQTTRGNGFAKRIAQVWPAADLGCRLSRRACRRPALGARADRYNTFGIAAAFAPDLLPSKRADDPNIPGVSSQPAVPQRDVTRELGAPFAQSPRPGSADWPASGETGTADHDRC